jgi:hypothetical protein
VDLDLVRERLPGIAALAVGGRPAEAREACADLLFDFQPLITAHAGLLARTIELLGQCGATALRRRLLVAINGDEAAAPGPVISIQRRAGPRSPSRWSDAAGDRVRSSTPVAEMASLGANEGASET